MALATPSQPKPTAKLDEGKTALDFSDLLIKNALPTGQAGNTINNNALRKMRL
jgi:hypothetical protein